MRKTMKAITLVTVILSVVAISSCCCQSQAMPGLRPMPKNLVTDQPTPLEPVKVLDVKGK